MEGLFDANTEISLERAGDYYFIKFSLNGEEIDVSEYTVKFRKPDGKADYTVYSVGGDKVKLEATVYGDYICFEMHGGMFQIYKNSTYSLTVLEIVLICDLSALVAAGITLLIIFLIKRCKKSKAEN